MFLIFFMSNDLQPSYTDEWENIKNIIIKTIQQVIGKNKFGRNED